MIRQEYYPQTFIEALGLHMLLEGLGYCAEEEEIFFVIHDGEVTVLLDADGKQMFFYVGRAEHDDKKMREKWEALVEDWNSNMSIEELRLFYESSMTRNRQTEVIFCLTLRGFDRWSKKSSTDREEWPCTSGA